MLYTCMFNAWAAYDPQADGTRLGEALRQAAAPATEAHKAVTTAVLEPGTFLGEMALRGQRLQQSYAEALSPYLICLMSRDDVSLLLLADPRIAARITKNLGQRLISAEQRLSDFAFKSIPSA